MSSLAKKTSRWYYVISLLVLIGGWSLLLFILFQNNKILAQELTQIVVPGQWEITLSKRGRYTVFYESKSIVNNKVYTSNKSLSGLKCVVTSNTTGKPVALAPSSDNLSYSVGRSRAGVSVLNFNIDQPGIYEFSCGYSQGKEGSEVVLAIGKLTGTVFILAIFFGSGAIAVAIAVVTFLRRRKAKQQLRDSSTY
jgi:hypothetical protein